MLISFSKCICKGRASNAMCFLRERCARAYLTLFDTILPTFLTLPNPVYISSFLCRFKVQFRDAFLKADPDYRNNIRDIFQLL